MINMSRHKLVKEKRVNLGEYDTAGGHKNQSNANMIVGGSTILVLPVADA